MKEPQEFKSIKISLDTASRLERFKHTHYGTKLSYNELLNYIGHDLEVLERYKLASELLNTVEISRQFNYKVDDLVKYVEKTNK